MAAEDCQLSEITPDTPTWTARVTVVEKSHPKTSLNTGTRYQSVLLMDMQKNTVRAMIYDHHINAFQQHLLVGKTYRISRAVVRPAPQKFQKYPGEMQWTLNGRTTIQCQEDDQNELLFSSLTICSFTEMHTHINTTKKIDITGLVMDVKPPRTRISKAGDEILLQDIYLTDKSFQTVIFTIFGAFVENEGASLMKSLSSHPIIIATHLLVTSYNGVSLSSTNDTYIYINLRCDHVSEFRKWATKNGTKIDHLITTKTYSPPTKIRATATTKFTTIENMCTASTEVAASQGPPYWYMSCNLCKRLSSTDVPGDSYSCRSCSNVAIATPRARGQLEIIDATGQINATIMGQVAEDFYKCTASQLMIDSKMEKNQEIRLQTTAPHLLYLKKIPLNTREPTYKFEVIALEPYQSSKRTQLDSITSECSTKHAHLVGEE